MTDTSSAGTDHVLPRQPAVFVTVVARRLGVPVAIRELDDPGVRDNVDVLEDQGVTHVRVSPLSTADLALAVTPQAPGDPRDARAFQAVVLCTDSLGGDIAPGHWVRAYQKAAQLESTRTLYVTGSECANFALALDVASGLIGSGAADAILLVLVDNISSESRFTPISNSAYSDGAVACLVSGTASPGSFELVRSATETRLPRDDTWGDLADARTTLTAMSAAARRAVGEGPADRFRHLLTLNLGDTARRLLAMAAPVPLGRLYSDSVRTTGHCFAADIPLNLQDLVAARQLADGDEVLALASSRHAFSAMAFRFQGHADAATA